MQVILENVRSVHNVASIFRSAEAAGVERIYLAGFSPDPFNRLGEKREQFVKVSFEAEDVLSWERVKKVKDLINALKKQGFEIVVVELGEKSLSYTKFRPKDLGKTVFIFGHEREGVSKELLNLCDRQIMIPMRGRNKSLNVAVAFGIITHHYANVDS